MANLTLSLEDELLQKGREYAASRGTSLNALVREFISDLTGPSITEVSDIMSRLRSTPGDSGGTKVRRESLYQR